MIDKTHGDVMRRYRKDHGLTQAEMAHKLGMSQQVYSNFENGQDLKLGFLKTYMRVTGIDLGGFAKGVEARIFDYKTKLQELQFAIDSKDALIRQLREEISFLRGLVGQSVLPGKGPVKKKQAR